MQFRYTLCRPKSSIPLRFPVNVQRSTTARDVGKTVSGEEFVNSGCAEF
jgi:hypothetical protein